MHSTGTDNGMGKKFDGGSGGAGGAGGRCITCCGGSTTFVVWVGGFIAGGQELKALTIHGACIRGGGKCIMCCGGFVILVVFTGGYITGGQGL